MLKAILFPAPDLINPKLSQTMNFSVARLNALPTVAALTIPIGISVRPPQRNSIRLRLELMIGLATA